MDSRVIKTKKGLKAALIRLISKTPFEKITVSEICKESITSRITFYTYYQDKYSLVDEMFNDYINEADENYHRMRDEYNKSNNGIKNYEILLECILSLFYDNFDFFSHTDSDENPYLFSEFYNHVFLSVDRYLVRHPALVSNYPTRQTAALLCNGLFGVINSCISEKKDENEVRKIARAMYKDILSSNLFTKKRRTSEITIKL